jgi:hypothetical protein
MLVLQTMMTQKSVDVLFLTKNCLSFAVSALNSLKSKWTNFPRSWSSNSDPCDGGWDGVDCSNGRVQSL